MRVNPVLPNPVLLEVFKNRFASIAEEMGVTLTRTAFSPNIKERRDLSCAVFDGSGAMLAQAAHIPVHLGSMPLSVQAAIEAAQSTGGFAPGDMVILNDPFKGGTHLPDVTLVAPVFMENHTGPAFYVANRAHHADVGGMSAGSMPLSTSLFQEGLIIPPLRLVKAGTLDRELLALILNNVRTPAEREGDFAAQIMANLTGARRVAELAARYGAGTVSAYAAALSDHAEKAMRAVISAMPDGAYAFTDYLDGDGVGATDIAIRLTLTIAGETATLDFTASDDSVRGSVNAVRAITLSAALYVFRCLGPDSMPTNAGAMRPIIVLTRPGSVVDATFPAATAGSNVETSQRLVDVILGALAQALPETIPAASQGTMNNVAIGGIDSRSGHAVPFAYYETLAGGMGASPKLDGESAAHSHMTNTLNTPIEALEYGYPFRVRSYRVRPGSGGDGLHRGGDGLVREVELLADAEVTVLSERRARPPYGLHGGEPGGVGVNEIVSSEGTGGSVTPMPGKFTARLEAGDSLRISTPGGGGWGQREKGKPPAA